MNTESNIGQRREENSNSVTNNITTVTQVASENERMAQLNSPQQHEETASLTNRTAPNTNLQNCYSVSEQTSTSSSTFILPETTRLLLRPQSAAPFISTVNFQEHANARSKLNSNNDNDNNNYLNNKHNHSANSGVNFDSSNNQIKVDTNIDRCNNNNNINNNNNNSNNNDSNDNKTTLEQFSKPHRPEFHDVNTTHGTTSSSLLTTTSPSASFSCISTAVPNSQIQKYTTRPRDYSCTLHNRQAPVDRTVSPSPAAPLLDRPWSISLKWPHIKRSASSPHHLPMSQEQSNMMTTEGMKMRMMSTKPSVSQSIQQEQQQQEEEEEEQIQVEKHSQGNKNAANKNESSSNIGKVENNNNNNQMSMGELSNTAHVPTNDSYTSLTSQTQLESSQRGNVSASCFNQKSSSLPHNSPSAGVTFAAFNHNINSHVNNTTTTSIKDNNNNNNNKSVITYLDEVNNINTTSNNNNNNNNNIPRIQLTTQPLSLESLHNCTFATQDTSTNMSICTGRSTSSRWSTSINTPREEHHSTNPPFVTVTSVAGANIGTHSQFPVNAHISNNSNNNNLVSGNYVTASGASTQPSYPSVSPSLLFTPVAAQCESSVLESEKSHEPQEQEEEQQQEHELLLPISTIDLEKQFTEEASKLTRDELEKRIHDLRLNRRVLINKVDTHERMRKELDRGLKAHFAEAEVSQEAISNRFIRQLDALMHKEEKLKFKFEQIERQIMSKERELNKVNSNIMKIEHFVNRELNQLTQQENRKLESAYAETSRVERVLNEEKCTLEELELLIDRLQPEHITQEEKCMEPKSSVEQLTCTQENEQNEDNNKESIELEREHKPNMEWEQQIQHKKQLEPEVTSISHINRQHSQNSKTENIEFSNNNNTNNNNNNNFSINNHNNNRSAVELLETPRNEGDIIQILRNEIAELMESKKALEERIRSFKRYKRLATEKLQKLQENRRRESNKVENIERQFNVVKHTVKEKSTRLHFALEIEDERRLNTQPTSLFSSLENPYNSTPHKRESRSPRRNYSLTRSSSNSYWKVGRSNPRATPSIHRDYAAPATSTTEDKTEYDDRTCTSDFADDEGEYELMESEELMSENEKGQESRRNNIDINVNVGDKTVNNNQSADANNINNNTVHAVEDDKNNTDNLIKQVENSNTAKQSSSYPESVSKHELESKEQEYLTKCNEPVREGKPNVESLSLASLLAASPSSSSWLNPPHGKIEQSSAVRPTASALFTETQQTQQSQEPKKHDWYSNKPVIPSSVINENAQRTFVELSSSHTPPPPACFAPTSVSPMTTPSTNIPTGNTIDSTTSITNNTAGKESSLLTSFLSNPAAGAASSLSSSLSSFAPQLKSQEVTEREKSRHDALESSYAFASSHSTTPHHNIISVQETARMSAPRPLNSNEGTPQRIFQQDPSDVIAHFDLAANGNCNYSEDVSKENEK